LKELAVNPMHLPWAERAVTMVTPVANMPSALRNSVWEKLGGRARGGRTVEGIATIYPKFGAFAGAGRNNRWLSKGGLQSTHAF
jgi:hypothetical protein